MVVAGGPVQQRRAKVVHAVPDGCDVVGRGAGAAVAHGPQPDLDGGADVRGEAVEFAFQPPSKEARRSSTSTPISSSTSPTRSTLIDSARSAGKISELYTLSPAVCLDRMMISARRTSSRVPRLQPRASPRR